jgi:DNA mismatch endonuclease, patch repair protein
LDTLTKEHRSWNMSRIKSRDTNPEKTVRSLLHNLNYRFRIHRKDLPGKPDIVLPRYKTVIFVHGCFWHRHRNCKYAYTPKSRVDFWQQKFEENQQRDRRAKHQLQKLGWRVVTVWECETKQIQTLSRRIKRLLPEP